MDIQYLIFCLWLTGKIQVSSGLLLFLPVFIINCAALLLIPVLLFLVYKNEYWKNRVMNICLVGAILTAFIFCLYYNSLFNGDSSSRANATLTLLISIIFITTYAIFKNQMHKLYFNLIAMLYLENDYRDSPFGYPWVKLLNNFVRASSDNLD